MVIQIGSGLTGVMYVLDEPSIGLHQRDNARLLDTLRRLRDIGNTVIVVEHDRDAIESADHVVDIGLGAGEHGGRVIAEGTPADIRNSAESLTGQYLTGRRAPIRQLIRGCLRPYANCSRAFRRRASAATGPGASRSMSKEDAAKRARATA